MSKFGLWMCGYDYVGEDWTVSGVTARACVGVILWARMGIFCGANLIVCVLCVSCVSRCVFVGGTAWVCVRACGCECMGGCGCVGALRWGCVGQGVLVLSRWGSF